MVLTSNVENHAVNSRFRIRNKAQNTFDAGVKKEQKTLNSCDFLALLGQRCSLLSEVGLIQLVGLGRGL